jgi:hypothetical protein
LKKTLHRNTAGGVAQGEGPEFKYLSIGKKCEKVSSILPFKQDVRSVNNHRDVSSQGLTRTYWQKP